MTEREEAAEMDDAQQPQQQDDAPEASEIIGRGEDDEQEQEEEQREEEQHQSAAPADPPTPQPRPTQQQQQQSGPKKQPPLRPYRPLSRFAHPFYWGNVLLFAAEYAAFRAQWLGRAAAHQQQAAAASATTQTQFIPYSQSLTKPSDLTGWERQILFTYAAVALFKALIKRRSWDAAAANLLFYARALVAVVLFYCDRRWLLLHALACWFGYAAMAQPVIDLDALASARIEEAAAKAKAEAEAKAAAAGASAVADATTTHTTTTISSPSPSAVALSGFSLPMNPPRLRDHVLVEASAAEAAAAEAAALLAGGGASSAKKAAKLLRAKQKLLMQQQEEQEKEQQGGGDGGGSSSTAAAATAVASVAAAAAAATTSATAAPPSSSAVGSADYWVLLIGCLSGGHHADSAAYAPAHAHLAHRYRDGAAAGAAAAATTTPPTTPPARPRLRFAHLDASLFGAYCAATPALALPPAQQLAWSRAVPCVLLIDGRTGKELARLPTRAQADNPMQRNLFTAGDVERAFDLGGIVAGRVPKVPVVEKKEGEDSGSGAGGGGGGKGKKKSKDA